MSRPTLSVVITSAGDERALERCLFSVVGQPDAAEVIVADCSRRDVAGWAADRFPDVRVLQFREPRTVPAIRWAAVLSSSGEIVAVTESRMAPAADWCATLVEAHQRWPDAAAIGGLVSLPAHALPRDRGLYLCEYPSFIPPAVEGPVRHLTGANVSYKRSALDAARDILDAGRWEPILHDRWLSQGRELRLCAASVELQGVLDARAACAMRFHYGRQYAADRSAGWPVGRRLGYGAASPVLPALILRRVRRSLRGKPARTLSWGAVPWLLLFTTLWAAGEGVGYLAGRANVDRIY